MTTDRDDMDPLDADGRQARRRLIPDDSCARTQEAASARLDGERLPIPEAVLDRHLSACTECRDRVEAMALVARRMRVAPAPVVPDLTERIVAAVDMAGRVRRERQRRWVVALAGLVTMALALPGLVRLDLAMHASREAAMFEVAVGLTIVLVAWRPARLGPGVFPLVAAVAGLGLVASGIDLGRGVTTMVAEVVHLPPVVAAVLVWPWARQPQTPRRAHQPTVA